MQSCYLICVTGQNNNKFYEMHDLGDGTFRAEYGRVGVTRRTKVYPISRWDSKYREEIRKGYKDVTHLHVNDEMGRDFISIQDPAIQSLLDFLRRDSSKSVASNYTVDSSQVTKGQVKEAQRILDEMADTKKVVRFNDLLLRLYTTIPRRMSHVQDFLINSKPERQDVLTKEQKTLDVMRTEVDTAVSKIEPNQTILDAMGIKIVKPTDQELVKVKALFEQEMQRHISVIHTVVNLKTEGGFERSPGTQFLFHGSRNQNWMNILSTGLVIRPTAANGSMFGRGLYFADRARKSAGYTNYWEGRGYLGVFEVNLGSPLHVHRHASWCKSLPRDSRMEGYDSVHAYAGVSLKNPEYIVYRNSQATIRHLVELRG